MAEELERSIRSRRLERRCASNHRRVPRFLGNELRLPAGSVRVALPSGDRVVIAHLRWLGMARFELCIEPVDPGAGVESVMQRHTDHLAAIVREHPGARKRSAIMDDAT
jgi:lauroyl/myristoyl acyltransferase